MPALFRGFWCDNLLNFQQRVVAQILVSVVHQLSSHDEHEVETCKYIIKSNPSVRLKWEKFVSEFKDPHFLTAEEAWDLRLEDAKSFLSKNGKRPSTISKDEDEKVLAKWIDHQLSSHDEHDVL